MARKRLQMKKLREILRLKYERGLSHRAVSKACSIGLGTVTLYLKRAAEAGLTWPLPDDVDDVALESMVFCRSTPATGRWITAYAPMTASSYTSERTRCTSNSTRRSIS